MPSLKDSGSKWVLCISTCKKFSFKYTVAPLMYCTNKLIPIKLMLVIASWCVLVTVLSRSGLCMALHLESVYLVAGILQ